MAGIIIIMVLVFILPFTVKKVEEELEIFLFVMGLAAATAAGAWSMGLIKEALSDPVKITAAVLAAGVLFRYLQKPMAHNINRIERKIGLKAFLFLTVAVLGLLSSVITAIVSALVLVEIVGHLKLDKKARQCL